MNWTTNLWIFSLGCSTTKLLRTLWEPRLLFTLYYYIISSVIHTFWLVLTYDLLEDRRIDDVTIRTFFNISDTLGCASCATFLFLPHFDVICDLLLNRHTATWNLFVNVTLVVNIGRICRVKTGCFCQ